MTKLDWNYDERLGCEVAYHNGYRIRAVQDHDSANPFEDTDGNWPIAVYYGRAIKVYEKTKGQSIIDPLNRFSNGQLVHDQKTLEKLLGAERIDLHLHGVEWDEDELPPKWVTDADALRSWFQDAIYSEYDSKKLDLFEELYKLLGIPCYKTTSRGYSQGDWAEVLVVATPEAQEECAPGWRHTGDLEAITKDLEATADLYGSWAWGDVYGYVIEKPIFDDDGDIVDWEEIEDGSCWGFYGDDHTKSGLEEQALCAVPDEVIRSPEAIEESV